MIPKSENVGQGSISQFHQADIRPSHSLPVQVTNPTMTHNLLMENQFQLHHPSQTLSKFPMPKTKYSLRISLTFMLRFHAPEAPRPETS